MRKPLVPLLWFLAIGTSELISHVALAQELADAPDSAPAEVAAQPPSPAPGDVPALPASVPPPPADADPDKEPPSSIPRPNVAPLPQTVAASPPVAAGPVAPPPGAAGQWVYTTQYGWIYMPYGQPYTYVDAPGEIAFSYVYYPVAGWRWVTSPWVFGWGPRPYWGVYGYGHFAWHAHPWFHVGVYRPAVWGRWGHPHWGGRAYAPVYRVGPRPHFHGGGGHFGRHH